MANEPVTIRRPAADLYRFWRDLNNLEQIIHHPVSITTRSAEESHWSVSAPAGLRVEWDSLIINDEPDRLIAWRSREGAQVDNAGTVRFQPAPGDEGTEVTVALEYDPPGGRLGAATILSRRGLEMGTRPLEKGLWAGAIDAVGGATLAWLTRTMLPQGVITAFGNAGGAELSTTVMPFILRGVRLLGISGGGEPAQRREVWRKLGAEYRPRRLERIARTIALDDVPQAAAAILEGRARGRTLIRFPS